MDDLPRAGLLPRVCSSIVDLNILVVPIVVLVWVLQRITGNAFFALGVAPLVFGAYYVQSLASGGQTIGCSYAGIYVVSEDGEPVGHAKAFRRFIALIAPFLASGLMYWIDLSDLWPWALLLMGSWGLIDLAFLVASPGVRALHDIFSRTLTVFPPETSSRDQSTAAMKGVVALMALAIEAALLFFVWMIVSYKG